MSASRDGWPSCHAGKIIALAAAVGFYVAAAKSDTSAQTSSPPPGLRFEPTLLQPADNGLPLRGVGGVRDVHPALRHMDAWISSVGAGVALADISGTGLPVDICLVDPRNDSVTVMPAPQSRARYRPFALPTPVEGYDPRTVAPMGCVPADLNQDGLTDLLVYYWGRTPVAFIQTAEGEFGATRFRPREIVAERERWFTNAGLLADVDGDGHPDLLFGNYFPEGDRILDPSATDRPRMGTSMSRAYNGGTTRLLLWRGATTEGPIYEDASAALAAVMPPGWALAMAAADLDGDLLPEIFVANDFGPDRLLLNRSVPGRPSFQLVEGRRDLLTPRSRVLGRDSFKGMGVDFGSITGDGRLAIAVSNIAERYALIEGHQLFVHTGGDGAWERGVAPYRDQGERRGISLSAWAWDIKFADLMNAGRPALLQATGFIAPPLGSQGSGCWPQLHELAMANDGVLRHPAFWPRFSAGCELSGRGHDRLFVPDSRGRYHDVWPALGLPAAVANGTTSRGIALGDVYGDGRLAVVIARQWMPSLFLRNVSVGVGDHLVLDLRVPGALGGTVPAIGATARLRLGTGEWVSAQVDGGGGHSGKRAPEIHLGLGHPAPGQRRSDDVSEAEIAWRDGRGVQRTTCRLLPGRHRIVLEAPHQSAGADCSTAPKDGV
jgi:hypothetical protein